MSEPVQAVANFFIKKSAEERKPITPMKLLKLVYIAHGWHLGLTQTTLIDESVEAWRYGPVIPSLYRKFKSFGDSPIPESAIATNVQLSSPERLEPFLQSVWNIYSKYDGLQLSSMTHAPNTPWYQVWHVEEGKNYMGADIPNRLIQQHYMEKAATNAG